MLSESLHCIILHSSTSFRPALSGSTCHLIVCGAALNFITDTKQLIAAGGEDGSDDDDDEELDDDDDQGQLVSMSKTWAAS